MDMQKAQITFKMYYKSHTNLKKLKQYYDRPMAQILDTLIETDLKRKEKETRQKEPA